MKIDSEIQTIVPTQDRARLTKDKIFAAALKVFAQKGPAGARIDEIADLAGVNKQRIYAYFGSKQELYRGVLIDVYSSAAANKRLMALGENEIADMTAVIVDVFFEIHEKNPEFWRLLSWENLNGGSSLSASDWEQIRNVYISHLRVLYHQGQGKGIFRKEVDFTTYLLLMFSVTYFYFSNQLTISRLLDLKLSSGAIRQKIEKQVLLVMSEGVMTGK